MSTLTNKQGNVYMLIKNMQGLMYQVPTLLLIVCMAVVVAACTPTGTTPNATANSLSSEPTPTAEQLATRDTTPVLLTDPVGDLIVEYLQARIASDETRLRELTCAEQEKNISIHVNSFKGQDASLRDVMCTFDGTNKVSCTGEIVLVYDGEEQTRPTGAFSVVEEDGRWLWCGETR